MRTSPERNDRMFMKGEALVGTVTVSFTVSGKRNEWTVTITAPGGIVTTDETVEATPYPLLSEMLTAAVDSAKGRRHSVTQSEAVR